MTCSLCLELNLLTFWSLELQKWVIKQHLPVKIRSDYISNEIKCKADDLPSCFSSSCSSFYPLVILDSKALELKLVWPFYCQSSKWVVTHYPFKWKWLYSFGVGNKRWLYLFPYAAMSLLCGGLVQGPYSLISTAVSADLVRSEASWEAHIYSGHRLKIKHHFLC